MSLAGIKNRDATIESRVSILDSHEDRESSVTLLLNGTVYHKLLLVIPGLKRLLKRFYDVLIKRVGLANELKTGKEKLPL